MLNGVARDILHEAQRGYDLLVMGKSGTSELAHSLTGTVTSKLMSRTFFVPLAVVTGTPENRNVVFGYDGSPGADKAVASAGNILRKDLDALYLCHVIRTFNVTASSFIQEYRSLSRPHLHEMESALSTMRREQMGPKMNAACQVLIRQGFSPSTIRFSFVDKTTSRSQALIAMADKQPCSTLVVGRRGHTAVEEFFMGRVGRKSVELSRDMAVWII
jgi:nucleotide-binding universal stress UspA family protein